tara:strand:- start:454 stop:855 length:402 start_codon:yes stop_codon:yes gene_type:complete
MNTPTHPFVALRSTIRKAASQYRRNNDTSSSLFHPTGGFLHAYDIPQVEKALNDYEVTLPSDYQKDPTDLTVEEQLMEQATQMSADHESMEVRDFARRVAGFLVMNVSSGSDNKVKLRLLRTDKSVIEDGDEI